MVILWILANKLSLVSGLRLSTSVSFAPLPLPPPHIQQPYIVIEKEHWVEAGKRIILSHCEMTSRLRVLAGLKKWGVVPRACHESEDN
jgi:hypothetical protein